MATFDSSYGTMGNTRVNVLLTFDYELPLGGLTGSYEQALFAPAQNLLDSSKRLDYKVVLFADILSYTFFKAAGVESFYKPFETQLQEALKNGHDVQLHLHPHWLHSVYSERGIELSGAFRLGDLYADDSPNAIADCIKLGVDSLNEVCKSALPGYRCIAYRGGGYNLEPHSDKILRSLRECGIQFDSSIAPGYCFYSDMNRVDYRNVPDLPNWYLDESGDLSKAAAEGIYEVPIATVSKSLFELPTFLKARMRKYAARAPESFGQMIHNSAKLSFSDKLAMFQSNRMLCVDNHTYEKSYLRKIHTSQVSRFRNSDEISFALIGHPKTMGTYSLELLEFYVENVIRSANSGASIHTFRSLSGKMNRENAD